MGYSIIYNSGSRCCDKVKGLNKNLSILIEIFHGVMVNVPSLGPLYFTAHSNTLKIKP